MTLPSLKICRRIRQLFRLIGSSNPNEAAVARKKLDKILLEHALSWNDIPGCIAEADAADGIASQRAAASHAPPQTPPGDGSQVNVLDLVLYLVETHIAATPEERLAIALWILHTYVFDRFDVTPRLAALSPVRGCGKTTLLILLDLLANEPYRTDNVTAAVIYHLLDRQPYSLLIDEGDNLGLLSNGVLRAVFNSGHRRGGSIDRFVDGRPRKFPTFAPLAVAAIGLMPFPLLHRAIVINMQRAGGPALARLDEQSAVFSATRVEIRKWAETCTLKGGPNMPPVLRNRAADNCRVLLSIADDLGYGEAARAAMVILFANRPDEDFGVVLLTDIRGIFDRLNIDRVASTVLVDALLALDESMWTDWRGPNDSGPSRKLNQTGLSRLLRPFDIRPRTIRLAGDRTSRGYLRSQFESAWAAYCPRADTPTQASKIIRLARAQSDT
jgi:uncharacterized protein DUF3631